MKTTEMINVTAANTEISRNFKDERLKKATEKIVLIYTQAAKYADEKNREIAKVLADVAEKEAYKADGFNSVADYAHELFGLNRQNAYSLANAGKVYKNAEAHPTLKAMTPSKLAELSGVDNKKLQEALDSGKITTESTQKELREFAVTAKEELPKKAKIVTMYTAVIVGFEATDSMADALKTPRSLEEWDMYFVGIAQMRHNSPVEMVKLPNGKMTPSANKATVTRRLYINQGAAIAVEFFTYTVPAPPVKPKAPKFTKAELMEMLKLLEEEEANDISERDQNKE